MISEIARRSAGSECALASELLPGSSLTVRVYSVTHFISFSLDVRVTVCFLGLHVRPLVVAFRCGNYEITQNMKRSVVTQKKKEKSNLFSFKAEQSHFLSSCHQFMILTAAGSSCYVQLRTNVNPEKHIL